MVLLNIDYTPASAKSKMSPAYASLAEHVERRHVWSKLRVSKGDIFDMR